MTDELALFTREFEQEVQASFPPHRLQKLALSPLAWLAKTPRPRSGPYAQSCPPHEADRTRNRGESVISPGLSLGLYQVETEQEDF